MKHFWRKPRGTWKGVVVLIVATHRSTQGFRQFDGSLLSCGNNRTWWKRSVAPLSSGKMLFRHVGMIYGIHIYIHKYICGYVLFGSERSDKLIVFSKTLLLQRGSHQRRSAKQGTWPTWIDSKTNKSNFPQIKKCSPKTPFFHNDPRFKNMHLSYILTFFVSAEQFLHVQKHV